MILCGPHDGEDSSVFTSQRSESRFSHFVCRAVINHHGGMKRICVEGNFDRIQRHHSDIMAGWQQWVGFAQELLHHTAALILGNIKSHDAFFFHQQWCQQVFTVVKCTNACKRAAVKKIWDCLGNPNSQPAVLNSNKTLHLIIFKSDFFPDVQHHFFLWTGQCLTNLRSSSPIICEIYSPCSTSPPGEW